MPTASRLGRSRGHSGGRARGQPGGRARGQPGGRARGRPNGRSQFGFTLVEALVGLGLTTLILLGLMSLWGAGWRTERQAMTDSELNRLARDTMYAIINGDPGEHPPVQGLIRANAVVTSPGLSALAYRVTWTEGSGASAVQHDDEVAYYFSGNTIYRVVSDFVDPVNIVTAGGTAVAEHVTTFGVTANTGLEPVGLTITVTSPFGSNLTLETTVLPRNVPR